VAVNGNVKELWFLLDPADPSCTPGDVGSVQCHYLAFESLGPVQISELNLLGVSNQVCAVPLSLSDPDSAQPSSATAMELLRILPSPSLMGLCPRHVTQSPLHLTLELETPGFVHTKLGRPSEATFFFFFF
jgi:hypothetical protein